VLLGGIKMEKKKSIKEYTLWLLNEKYNQDVGEEDVDCLMFSYGFKHDQRVIV